jgi:hypothetical protein
VSADEVIMAATSIARDVAEGRLDPAEVDRVAAEEFRRLFATVVGPEDPAWPAQVEACRGVLAAGGIPVGELSEWLGLARHREESANGGESSEAETVVGVVDSPADVVSAAELDRVERDLLAMAAEGAQTEPEPEVNPYGAARRIVARGRDLPDAGLQLPM